jgi:hypothetical protein
VIPDSSASNVSISTREIVVEEEGFSREVDGDFVHWRELCKGVDN